MQRIHITILMMFAFVWAGYSQPAWTQIDSLTYSQYLAGEWKELLKETDKSLKDGIDFYYLRVRAGIAAYELKNYRLAALHLEKAHEWNTSDEFVNYWYFYALEMAGRKDEARLLGRGFSNDFSERMQIKPVGKVNYVLAESQLTINGDHSGLLNDFQPADNSYISYRSVLKQQLYKGFGIDHQAGDGRLFAFHGLSHLGISRTQLFRSGLTGIKLDQEGTASQFQYYVQGRYLLPKGWSVNSSLTLLWGQSRNNWVSYTQTGTAVMNYSTYSISDLLFNSSLSKELTWGRPKISAAIGNINGYSQWQVNGQLVLYPFGNTNFYLTADYTFHKDESEPEVKKVFSPKAGIKTGPLWLIFHGATGKIKNFGAGDGYVLYNIPETIHSIYGATAYIPLMKYRMGLSLRYQLSEKEGMTFDYANTVDYSSSTYKFRENNFLISITYSL